MDQDRLGVREKSKSGKVAEVIHAGTLSSSYPPCTRFFVRLKSLSCFRQADKNARSPTSQQHRRRSRRIPERAGKSKAGSADRRSVIAEEGGKEGGGEEVAEGV